MNNKKKQSIVDLINLNGTHTLMTVRYYLPKLFYNNIVYCIHNGFNLRISSYACFFSVNFDRHFGRVFVQYTICINMNFDTDVMSFRLRPKDNVILLRRRRGHVVLRLADAKLSVPVGRPRIFVQNACGSDRRV